MRYSALVIVVAAFVLAQPADAQQRLLTAEDINSVHALSDPRVSPEGEWVAYQVRTADMAKDKRVTHIWMASWDGTRQVQLTYSPQSEHTPRWSPDGRYLAFLTARGGDEDPEQVWLLDRLGGEEIGRAHV